jgi:GTP cyclohydrolase FolE2
MDSRLTPDFSVVYQKTFVDIPSSRPEVEIPLARVGVTNRPLTLTLEDPFRGVPVTLPCRISVFSSLKASQRGLHMSRIEEAIDEVRTAALLPSRFVEVLADLICKTQGQERCGISLEADYEHRANKNPSGKSSVELLSFLSRAERLGNQTVITTGIIVPFINACPCTQHWGMREFFTTLRKKGYDAQEAEEITRCAPLQAHTNRGKSTVSICDPAITHQSLYHVLDRAVPIIRELLKGPDEHAVVSATHRMGQFCEDNIRAILREIHAFCREKVSPTALITAEVDVDESVHFHNLTAGWSGTFEELQALLT